MDRSTHDVRRASWLNIITECQQSPVNVSVKQWLADNVVKEKAYYYWLRKFRREACEQMQFPDSAVPSAVSFAEFLIPVPAPVNPAVANNTAAVISANGMTIEISNGISYTLLCRFLRRWHMLEDVPGIRRVVLACGSVDLRKEIDGLAMIIGDKYGQNPFEKGTLFLFCGQRSDRIKGLLWMGTGFLLLYKRFEDGRLSWPRTTQEAADLTEEQFHYLMTGLNSLEPKIKEVTPEKVY